MFAVSYFIKRKKSENFRLKLCVLICILCTQVAVDCFIIFCLLNTKELVGAETATAIMSCIIVASVTLIYGLEFLALLKLKKENNIQIESELYS